MLPTIKMINKPISIYCVIYRHPHWKMRVRLSSKNLNQAFLYTTAISRTNTRHSWQCIGCNCYTKLFWVTLSHPFSSENMFEQPFKSPYHWKWLSTVCISKTCSGQGRTMMNRLSHLSASYRLSPLIDG